MQRALLLAARGQGRVEPNPMVGCVIVGDGKVIGEGYHHRYGGPHAETEALRAVGRAGPRGATAYVTLEPCCHFGKTPPCTDALIAAGIRRVVAAMHDPFRKVRGRGVRKLERAGIEVRLGLCAAQAMRLNAPYLKLQKTGRPWVILKWAQSLDGKIATRTGDSKWISGEESRRWTHRLRGRVDAIVVGVGTVIADDPELTCRHMRPKRIASRLVLDPHLRTPLAARVVQTAKKVPTVIVTDRRGVSSSRARALEKSGVELLGVRRTRGGFDLGNLLQRLGVRGMSNVLVEGGGRTLGMFFDAELADETVIFVARKLIGGRNATSALSGEGPAFIRRLRTPLWTRITPCGEDDVYELGWNGPVAGRRLLHSS